MKTYFKCKSIILFYIPFIRLLLINVSCVQLRNRTRLEGQTSPQVLFILCRTQNIIEVRSVTATKLYYYKLPYYPILSMHNMSFVALPNYATTFLFYIMYFSTVSFKNILLVIAKLFTKTTTVILPKLLYVLLCFQVQNCAAVLNSLFILFLSFF